MDADKTKMLFLFWLAAKNKKHFPICAGAQNENLFSHFRRVEMKFRYGSVFCKWEAEWGV